MKWKFRQSGWQVHIMSRWILHYSTSLDLTVTYLTGTEVGSFIGRLQHWEGDTKRVSTKLLLKESMENRHGFRERAEFNNTIKSFSRRFGFIARIPIIQWERSQWYDSFPFYFTINRGFKIERSLFRSISSNIHGLNFRRFCFHPSNETSFKTPAPVRHLFESQ